MPPKYSTSSKFYLELNHVQGDNFQNFDLSLFKVSGSSLRRFSIVKYDPEATQSKLDEIFPLSVPSYWTLKMGY